MPQFPPETLISRHVEKLLARGDQERVDELLRQCELTRFGTKVVNPRGTITEESCYRYKQLVKQLYGEAAYSFAKVNFVLGGCQCRDCGSS
ncbi:MAG TPA: hypothetical protein VEK57_09245 [Thermoanaerobaculia bacterium]|nr:hypothetical protein [Thermoanaerobaculia bacterium]